MNISVASTAPLEFAVPCLLVPLWGDAPLTGAAAALNLQMDGLISDIIESDNFKAKPGETRTLYAPGQKAPRVILFGLGKEAKFSAANLRKAVAKAARAALGLRKTEIALVLPTLPQMDAQSAAQTAAEGLILGLARFTTFKTDEDEKREIETVTLLAKTKRPRARASSAPRLSRAPTSNVAPW